MRTVKVWAIRGIFLAGIILMLAGCGHDEDYIYDEATYLVESYVQDQGSTLTGISEQPHTDIEKTDNGWEVSGTAWVDDNDGYGEYSVGYELSMVDQGDTWSSEIHWQY